MAATWGPEPVGEQLFDRTVFKEALKEVSKVRYTQTIAAKYPDLKVYMDALDGQKAEQGLASLSAIWQSGIIEAQKSAERLVGIGFFEKLQRMGISSYWIPFLYRGALKLVQGRA